jgi:hypothetical protein
MDVFTELTENRIRRVPAERKTVDRGMNEPRSSGPVYAFLPAHLESPAADVARDLSRSLSERFGLSVLLADFYARGFPLWGTPEAPQRLDGHSWGAFITPGETFDTLEAREAHPREIRRLLDVASRRYTVTCADLTQAKEVVALEVLRRSDAIFLVSTSDLASVNLVQFKVAWLQSLELEQNCGLILLRVPGGVSAPAAEELTGLPVCALLDDDTNVDHFAAWVRAAAQPARKPAAGAA